MPRIGSARCFSKVQGKLFRTSRLHEILRSAREARTRPRMLRPSIGLHVAALRVYAWFSVVYAFNKIVALRSQHRKEHGPAACSFLPR